MSRWFVFKCQNCGKRFKEKFSKENEKNCSLEHIAAKTHFVATHVCKPGVYGCGVLIGAENRTRGPKEATTDGD
jgi:hypothetical protein